MSDLKSQINEAVKTAMKAREKQRLATLRLVTAEIKRVEVDERRDLTDDDVVTILNKMVKQRNDSLTAFKKANRQDLADQEQFELGVVGEFLPEPLTDSDIGAAITAAIVETDAKSIKDMGGVMAKLKGKLAGRADMAKVSSKVKALLG